MMSGASVAAGGTSSSAACGFFVATAFLAVALRFLVFAAFLPADFNFRVRGAFFVAKLRFVDMGIPLWLSNIWHRPYNRY
jgi:hypothetical protein